MTVAVQKGLEHFAEALRQYGFDVVIYGEYNYRSMRSSTSARVCRSPPAVSSNNHEHHGVFMINARGKSAEDIAQILNRRTYTPCFKEQIA